MSHRPPRVPRVAVTTVPSVVWFHGCVRDRDGQWLRVCRSVSWWECMVALCLTPGLVGREKIVRESGEEVAGSLECQAASLRR